MLFGIRWGGLRTKIIAWVFIPVAIILIVVAWVNFYSYRRVTEALVIVRNRELAHLLAGELAAELTGYTAPLVEYAGLMAGLPRIAYAYEGELIVQEGVLRQARGRFEVFDGGVLILNNQGIVVAAEPDRPEVLGQNWSNRSYFRQMLSSPGTIFSNIVADGPEGAEVIVVAVPITGDQGRFLGMMVGMFRLDAAGPGVVSNSMARFQVRETGKLYLVDGNGRVSYHSDPDCIGDDLGEQAVVQQVLNGEVDAIRTHDVEGRDIVASFAPVPGTAWGLVAEESWSALIAPSEGYRRFLLLLLALGVAVPALVVTVGVGRITKPIAALIRASQEVAEGKFGQTITARTGDEVEELAEQFNLMAARLQESYTDLECKVADRTKELAALNAIATVVSQSLDLDEVLNDALDKTLQVMEIEAGGIYLLDEQAGELIVAAYRGFSPEFVAEINKLKLGEGFSGWVAQSGQPLVVDVSTDPRLTRMAAREEGFRSLACVPLSSKGEVLGTMFAATHGYREFTDQDVELLTSIGQQIGVAIENARLFKAEQRRAEQFQVISEVGHYITSILAVDELLCQIVKLIQETLGHFRVSIGLIEGDELVFKSSIGPGWNPPWDRPTMKIKVGQEGITGWVAATGEPLLVPDVSLEPRFLDTFVETPSRSELAVPLKTKEAVIGVLNVESDQLDAFDESDLTVLQSLAHQATVAVVNARLYEQVHERAIELERKAQRLALVNDLSATINSTLDLDQVLQIAVEQMTKIFSVKRSGLVIFDYQQGYGRVVARYPQQDPHHREVQIPLTNNPAVEQILKTRQPLPVEDVQSDPLMAPVRELGKLAGIVSTLIVPLVVKDEVIGTIGLDAIGAQRCFSEEEIDLAQTIANQISIALENARLFGLTDERLTVRVEQLAALQRVNDAANANLELAARLQAIIETTVQVSRVKAGSIYLCDKAGEGLILSAAVGLNPEAIGKVRLKLDEGLTGWVARERKPLSVSDITHEPRHKMIPGLGLERYRGWLGIPLCLDRSGQLGGQLLGVLNLRTVAPREFTAEEVDFLSTLAGRVSVAIDNARLFAESQRQLARLTALREIDHAINSPLTLQETLDVLLEGVSQVLPADACAVMRVNPATQELEFAASRGLSQEYQQALHLRVGESIAGRIAIEGQPISIAHLPTDPLTWDPALVEKEGLVSYLGVPLHLEERVIGVLSLYTRQPHVFSPEEVSFADTLGGQAAIAIEKARLLQEATEQAEQLATLNEIASTVSTILDLEEVLETIYRQTQRIIPTDAFFLAMYDPSTNRLDFKLLYDEGIRHQRDWMDIPASSLVEQVLQNRQPLLENRDLASLAQLAQQSLPERRVGNMDRSSASLMYVPLIAGDELVGVLSAQSYTPYAYTPRHLGLLSGIASHAAIAIQNARLFENIRRQARELTSLNEMGRHIASILDVEQLLELVVSLATQTLRAGACAIYLIAPEERLLVLKAAQGLPASMVRRVNFRIGEGLTGWTAMEARPARVADVRLDPRWKNKYEEAGEKITSLLSVPIVVGEKTLGVIELFHRAVPFTPEDEALLVTLASQVGIALENARLYQDVRGVYLSTIRSLATAIDARDPYTKGHSEEVARYAVLMARHLGWPSEEVERIEYAGLLHDAGKIGTTEAVLLKKGPLNPEEWVQMRLHPFTSAQIIKPVRPLAPIVPWVYHHHERWDGNGYLDGLAGERIPLGARILAVADTYSAITTDRPYRPARSPAEAIEELRRVMGSQLDPRVVETFLKILKRGV